jgi:hypothetical protein
VSQPLSSEMNVMIRMPRRDTTLESQGDIWNSIFMSAKFAWFALEFPAVNVPKMPGLLKFAMNQYFAN